MQQETTFPPRFKEGALGQHAGPTRQRRCAERPGDGAEPSRCSQNGRVSVGGARGQQHSPEASPGRGAGPAAKCSHPSPQTPSSGSARQCPRRLWGGQRGQPPEAPGLSPAAWACLPTSTLPANPAIHPAPGSSSYHLPPTAHVLLTPRATRHEHAAATMPGAARRPPRDRDTDPTPQAPTQTQITPKSPTTRVTEPRDSTKVKPPTPNPPVPEGLMKVKEESEKTGLKQHSNN